MTWLRKTPRTVNTVSKPTVLYRAWKNMRSRCRGQLHDGRGNYRWKGIRISKEFEDYSQFRKWAIASGFSPKRRSIDRIDSGFEYSPSNCQWLTKADHCRKSMETRWGGVYL